MASTQLVSADMGYPERLLSQDEVIETEFRPHWSGIIREGLFFVAALVIAILIAKFTEWPGWIYLVILFVVVALTIRGIIEWWHTLHVVTNERLIYRAGWIAKKGTEIPLEVIQNVAFNQTIIERMFGTGDLVVESAGTHGQTRYRDIPKPEAVQSTIYRMRELRMNPPQPEPPPAPEPQPQQREPSSAPTSSESVASQLEKLSRLHDQGKLTDQEFQLQKSKLLGGS